MSNFRQWVLGCLLVFLTACGSSTPEEQYASAVSELCEPFGMEAQGVCKRMIFASGVSLEVLLHRLNPDKAVANPNAGEGAKAKMESGNGYEVEFAAEAEKVAEVAEKVAEDAEVDALVAQLLGTLGSHNSGDNTRDHFANLDFEGAPTAPKNEMEGNVDLGAANITAVEGETQGVTSVVKRYKGRFKLCYDQALRQDPNLQGRVEIKFSVGRGRVLEASISTNTTRNDALANCILRKVKGLVFDQAVEADVIYPFVLSKR
jgi:hypothetical protein